jgi:uncharacterized protein (DUF4213/DUF364 family)
MQSRSDRLHERLLQHLRPALANREVAEVRLGLLYAGVRLADGATGLAHLLPSESDGRCQPLRSAGRLPGTPAAELAERVLSENVVEAAVGLATLNAVAPEAPGPHVAGDIRDLIAIAEGDRIGMVGYFAPLLPWLRGAGAEVEILELRSVTAPGVRPAQDAPAVLPECDVALLSATAIINHTLDDLLDLCTRPREVVVLGPSTPLVVEPFEGTPATLLAGVEVVESEEILRIVSEGGSTRQFGPAVRKLCVRVGRSRPAA